MWLEECVKDAPPESPWWESIGSDDASDYLAFAVQTDGYDDDDPSAAEAFWLRALGEEAPRIHHPAFLRGLGEGAVANVGQGSDRR